MHDSYDDVLLTMDEAGYAFDTTVADVETLVDLGYIDTVDIDGEPMIRIGDVPRLGDLPIIAPDMHDERRLPIEYQVAS